MRVVLFGPSSLAYWLIAKGRPAPENELGTECLSACTPCDAAVTHAISQFPCLSLPLHCMVPTWQNPRAGIFSTHTSKAHYPKGSFVRIADGIIAASPELVFVHMAQTANFLELIKVGSALCSMFAIDPAAENGLSPRPPLTNPQEIAAFLERVPGLKGVKQARRALPHVVENAASPPEIFLRMVLTLPRLYGGYGFSGCTTNQRLFPSRKAVAIAHRESLVPDLIWENAKLVVEFDSNSEHLHADQITLDSEKRLAYLHDGLTVITVTTKQLANPLRMRHVAEEIARRKGSSLRIRGSQFEQKHATLYRIGWSFATYHNSTWLDQHKDIAKTPSSKDQKASTAALSEQ